MDEPRFDDLTLPAPGAATLRQVMSLHANVLVRDLRSLPSSASSGVDRRTLDRVEALLRTDPLVVARALRVPTVQALLGVVRRRASSAAPEPRLARWARALGLHLLLELGAHGALAEPIEVRRDGPWPPLPSPTLRMLLEARREVDRITFESAGMTFSGANHSEVLSWAHVATPGRGALHERTSAYHPVWGRTLLATADANPLADVQAHPERPGNRLDLAGRSPEAWVAQLAEALAIVEAHLPELADEMRAMLALVVPVGDAGERHHSCSFEEAVGAVYLTWHASPMVLAEALVHEFQHNKLNAVFRFDPLLKDAYAPVHASPVRPDPRPLHGVLMAVHAFQPVALLYERMTLAGHPLSKGRDWALRRRQVLEINAEGARTVLAHGRPTPLGQGLLDEMRRLEERLSSAPDAPAVP